MNVCGDFFYSTSIESNNSKCALPYPKHGCQRMPAPMRSPCITIKYCYDIRTSTKNYCKICGRHSRFCFKALQQNNAMKPCPTASFDTWSCRCLFTEKAFYTCSHLSHPSPSTSPANRLLRSSQTAPAGPGSSSLAAVPCLPTPPRTKKERCTSWGAAAAEGAKTGVKLDRLSI